MFSDKQLSICLSCSWTIKEIDENTALVPLVGAFCGKTQLVPFQSLVSGQCRAMRFSFFSFSLAIFVFLLPLVFSLLSTFLLVRVPPQISYASLALPIRDCASSVCGQKR